MEAVEAIIINLVHWLRVNFDLKNWRRIRTCVVVVM